MKAHLWRTLGKRPRPITRARIAAAERRARAVQATRDADLFPETLPAPEEPMARLARFQVAEARWGHEDRAKRAADWRDVRAKLRTLSAEERAAVGRAMRAYPGDPGFWCHAIARVLAREAMCALEGPTLPSGVVLQCSLNVFHAGQHQSFPQRDGLRISWADAVAQEASHA